jgi:twitching motility protein PilT
LQEFDIDRLLRFALEKKASDVHLRARRPPLLRLRGGLTPLNADPLESETIESVARGMMSGYQQKIYDERLAVDLGYTPQGLDSRFRVAVYRQRGTPAITFRSIPHSLPTVASLGLPQSLKVFIKRPQGLVLVTGPTGAGKSTTLAALVNEINYRRAVHILTIEDPIEFVFEDNRASISQLEIGVDTVSFAAALRNALRQDPDVIMVGEMRDPETISTAITAAETGHLIFSTLHTNSASQSINRIIDSFPPSQHDQIRLQLSQALLGIISQRLVNRDDIPGRIAAIEIMINSPAIKEMVRMGEIKSIPDIIARSVDYYRMQTMDQSLIALIANRVVNVKEGLAVSQNPDDLKLSLTKLGIVQDI